MCVTSAIRDCYFGGSPNRYSRLDPFLPAHKGKESRVRSYAYAERFVLSIKSECLAKIIPRGERHLRKAVEKFTEHYHLERNHQGLDNELIEKSSRPVSEGSAVECRERLGGILKHYHRRAA